MIRQRLLWNLSKTNYFKMAYRLFQMIIIFIPVLFHLPSAAAAGGPNETPAEMVEALQQRSTQIDQRENTLKEREARLHLLEEEIRGMIREYSKLKEEVDQRVADRLSTLRQEEEKRLARLAKIYQAMPPKEAANRITRLEESTVLNLLRRIKEKSAAKILSNMSPAKAARFSEKFVKTKK